MGETAVFLDLLPDRVGIIGQSDYLMKIAKACVTVSVCLAYITRVIAMKAQIFLMLGKQITWKANVIYTIVLMYIPPLIGWSYPAVNDWVSLLGAFCMTSLTVSFPGLMYLKKNYFLNKKFSINVFMVGVWMVLFTCVGYVSALSTVLKMLHLTN